MSDQIPVYGPDGRAPTSATARPKAVTLSTDHQLLVEILAELTAIRGLLTILAEPKPLVLPPPRRSVA